MGIFVTGISLLTSVLLALGEEPGIGEMDEIRKLVRVGTPIEIKP